VSARDTAAVCGCPRLREAVAGPAATGLVLPPLVRAGELTLEPVGELGAHVGHGWPLQGQGLLGGQPTQPQAQQVAAPPAADDRAGGRLRVDPDLGPGVGRPGAQLHGKVGHKHQLPVCPVGVAGRKLIQHGTVRLRDSRVQQRGRGDHQHTSRLVVAGWVQAQAGGAWPGSCACSTPTTPPPRPKRRRRTILVAVGLALLIVGGVAGGGDPSPASAPASKAATPAPKSEADRPTTLKVGEVGTTVDALDRPTAEVLVAGVREARDDYGLVDGRWVVAAVEVTALRDNVSTPDLYVLDAKGQKFTPTYLAPDGSHLLDATSLQAGQSIAGVVAFDLPTRHGRLVLPHSDGEPQLVWKF
jgi:hypothetical protein